MPAYCVAAIRAWNIAAFNNRIRHLPGTWTLFQHRDDLTLESLRTISPRAIFFPHWSWKIPQDIVSAYECVAFHAADLPFGRGGSPIQNLIERHHHSTKVTAFRMNDQFDAGPIYMKRDLSLEGPAHEIFNRMAIVVADMIESMVTDWPTPVPQSGPATTFPRRTPAQSCIATDDIPTLYDHIRMLDAPDYPHAFVDCGNLRIEFTDAKITSEGLQAKALFRKKP
jgi:methionyl-tRNA formyltransferase